jgi:hypothetical protein
VCAQSYRPRTAVDDPPTASGVARARRRVVGRALLAPLVLAAFLSVPAGSASASIQFDGLWGSFSPLGLDGTFNGPSRAATDSSGSVYVTDSGNSRVQKFTSIGGFTSKFGSLGTGNGQFLAASALGIAVDAAGNAYVVDKLSNRVQKFDSNGSYLTQWGGVGTGNGQFTAPSGIATDSSGNVYVADTGNNRIQEFNSSGTFIRKWGSVGTADGQFTTPSGVAVDSTGDVYVADSGNSRIQKFSSTGTFITKWGSAGTGDGQFGPTTTVTLDLAIGPSDNVVVVDPTNSRVEKFRPIGTFITKWGTVGTGNSQFTSPSGVATNISSGEVYVVDQGNNRVQRFHETDTSPPPTTIDSLPYGLTNDASPSFAFSSTDPSLLSPGFECRLDTAEWASCTSPKAYSSLSDGAHTFHVRAVDAAGNPDLSPASESFTVDATPPDTTIDSGPPDPTNDATPNFSFSSEPGASFQCRFDSGTFAACSGPGNTHTPTSALGEGSHTFYVRAVDAAGNPDPSPDSQTFTVDTVPPNTGITGDPIGTTNDATPTFGFNASQGGSSFECRFDSDDFEPCSGPGATHTPSTPLADGLHTFEVQATDPAGNTDPSPAMQTFTVDTVPPDTTFLVPGGGPSGATNDPTPTFKFDFTSPEPGGTFKCSVDSGSWDPCTSPKTTSQLADGSHTFDVRATDPAGNTDLTPAHRAFTVDTVAPVTTIDPGPGLTNDPTPTFTFSSEAGSSFQCKVDSAPYAVCTSPKTTFHLPDGSHTFNVRAIDQAGNVGAPASRPFTVRTAAVHISGSTLVVTAAVGAIDNFVITSPSASVLRVTDSANGTYTGSGVHAWAGCTRGGDYTANCSATGITLIQVESGGRNDRVVNSTAIRSSLDGGSGDDTLTGGTGADVIKGMDGNDQLRARDGVSDTTINCDGGGADTAILDPLPLDPNSSVSGCETMTRP